MLVTLFSWSMYIKALIKTTYSAKGKAQIHNFCVLFTFENRFYFVKVTFWKADRRLLEYMNPSVLSALAVIMSFCLFTISSKKQWTRSVLQPFWFFFYLKTFMF